VSGVWLAGWSTVRGEVGGVGRVARL
jgi:hypothetical protein